MVKVTFSLDEETVVKLRRTAERQGKPQSLVVREAVADYTARADTLSEAERRRMLDVLERHRHAPATGTEADVRREIAGIRASRRASSLRRTPR